MGRTKVLKMLKVDEISLALLQDKFGDIGRADKAQNDELKIWQGKSVRIHKSKYTTN